MAYTNNGDGIALYWQSHFQLPGVNACHAWYFGLHTNYTNSLYGVNAFYRFLIPICVLKICSMKSLAISAKTCSIPYIFVFCCMMMTKTGQNQAKFLYLTEIILSIMQKKSLRKVHTARVANTNSGDGSARYLQSHFQLPGVNACHA